MSRPDKERELFVALARYKISQLDIVIAQAEAERSGFQSVINAAESTQISYSVGIEP